jgi:hypothetical protein
MAAKTDKPASGSVTTKSQRHLALAAHYAQTALSWERHGFKVRAKDARAQARHHRAIGWNLSNG